MVPGFLKDNPFRLRQVDHSTNYGRDGNSRPAGTHAASYNVSGSNVICAVGESIQANSG